MQRNIGLFFLFLAVLIVPALCQASSIILTRTAPNHTVILGSDEKIYGTSSSNQITLESGARAELINFPGQNVIEIQASSYGFTLFRSGTVVSLEDSTSETILKIPATTDPQTIHFVDRSSLTLNIHNGQVMLDDQIITLDPMEIQGSSENPGDCGAYVAPGVWKEFDCYNLAAIGKTTGDDPFTPSWRLIGGYWQWGRKGPDSSQWYDTNTEHFAHGPTGPGDQEANDGDITGWNNSYTPINAWCPGLQKSVNDPCPSGFQVPTKSQWQGVLNNNTHSTVGTWSIHDTSYSSALFLGNDLMLPATGIRYESSGFLYGRGDFSNYWSKSEYSSSTAWRLRFGSGYTDTGNSNHRWGLSVRCVAEDQESNIELSITKISLLIGDIETVSINGSAVYYKAISDNPSISTADINGNDVEITGCFPGKTVITIIDADGGTGIINVTVTSTTTLLGECGAYVAPGVWKEFDCYNLAAIGKTTNDDPFTPSWRLIGGYWQWGRKGPDPSEWFDLNTPNFACGPKGTGFYTANEKSINSWDQTDASYDAWSENHKTVNDPCHDGFRVPSRKEWDDVLAINTQERIGSTWSSGATEYSNGLLLGEALFLPAAGGRDFSSGSLYSRGYYGFYWSSSGVPFTPAASNLHFDSGHADTYPDQRRAGFSIRCIAN